MRNAILLAIFIIILVFINWFTDGLAQTIDTSGYTRPSSPAPQSQADRATPSTYSTPPIFDEGDMANDSLLDYHRKQSLAARESVLSARPDSIAQPFRDSITDHQLILPEKSGVRHFGDNLFAQRQIGEFNPSQAPEDYLLGPGDNLIISLWGRVQQEWNLTVDRQGKVFIPKVGEITAWGVTLREFEERLDNHLSAVYTGYKKKVTLGKIRTIRVFVYGEVRQPGGYALSALSTLFNALHLAGGPNERGTYRHIRLIRQEKTQEVDLYDFLVNGDSHCDIPLSSGDVVFVPLAGAQATVRGEVKRPAIYELTGGETIENLITLAGGPTAEAYLSRLMLDRISPEDARKVIDVDYTIAEGHTLPLADGDDLSIFSLYQMRHNLVWITGQVKHPGTFERSDSMRISDLLVKGQLLPQQVYMERADLYRRHPDGRVEIHAVRLQQILDGDAAADIVLADMDSLQIYHVDSVERKKFVFVDGAVKSPGRYPLYDRMTVGDLIFLSGNLQESAYLLEAELARLDENGRTSVIGLTLSGAESTIDLTLQENDHLFIRTIPGYQIHRTVSIMGEVKFPGNYSLTQKNETLWQLIQRTGGFTAKAFPLGTVFKRRAIVEDLERKRIGDLVESSLPLLADSTGMLRPADMIHYNPENMDRIIVDMERLMTTDGNEGDFKLQSGDFIYVPEMPTGVTVLGEVCASGTINFRPGKSTRFYLEQAGGFTKRADKGQTRLVKANGRVFASGTALSKKADLGDVIFVPTEIKKDRDWMKYIATTASLLTGLATTILIVDKL